MEVDFEQLAANCDGTDNCRCPIVVYMIADRKCNHKACEGLKQKCGAIIGVFDA